MSELLITQYFAEGQTTKINPENNKFIIEDCLVDYPDGSKRPIEKEYIGRELDNKIFRYPIKIDENEKESFYLTCEIKNIKTYLNNIIGHLQILEKQIDKLKK